jgi:hypothetical protein
LYPRFNFNGNITVTLLHNKINLSVTLCGTGVDRSLPEILRLNISLPKNSLILEKIQGKKVQFPLAPKGLLGFRNLLGVGKGELPSSRKLPVCSFRAAYTLPGTSMCRTFFIKAYALGLLQERSGSIPLSSR